MRYPYERFVIFLLSRKVDVNAALRRIELPKVGAMGLADRKERIRNSAPPALLRYLKQSDAEPELLFRDGILEWAGQNGIRSLWERQKEFGRKIDEAVEAASNIFLNPNARTVLGTLLLSETAFEDMVQVMDDQFSIEITEQILEPYKSIFWDVQGMGRREWENFIPDLDEDQRQVMSLGLRGMRTPDIRYAIGAEVPSDPRDVLQDILTHAHHQFRQAMAAPNPGVAGAFKWADLATKVASTMAASKKSFGGGGGEENQPSSEQAMGMFSVEIEPPKIITLDDLEGELSKTQSALDRAIEEQAS